MQTREQLFDKLAEVEALLKQATCDGEAFENNLGEYDDWAAELASCLRTLTDSIDYYVD
jgi:hypothetical protein